MIILSIDLRQIDQSRCKKVTKRDGTVASYCEIVLIETPDSKYGDFMAKQGVTKEEREARVEMPILGNAKHAGGQRTQRSVSPPPRTPATKPKQQDPDLDQPEEDVPF